MEDEPPRILIAGLGNFLLGDDGVGVHVVRELAKDPPPGTLVVEVGTAVLDALHLFEEAENILAVDAMTAGGKPGTVYSLPASGIAAPGAEESLHALNIIAALRLLKNNPLVLVLGVEPRTIDYGIELSAEVRSVIPVVIYSIRETVKSWRKGLGAPRGPSRAPENLRPF
ncbi:MAG TPA: hydrogenase maturation protease [Thermodesulfobacteriota bacterium]|nr:hydrogenase maturation protease [Thermodesulfobacteriota bacterium]